MYIYVAELCKGPIPILSLFMPSLYSNSNNCLIYLYVSFAIWPYIDIVCDMYIIGRKSLCLWFIEGLYHLISFSPVLYLYNKETNAVTFHLVTVFMEPIF